MAITHSDTHNNNNDCSYTNTFNITFLAIPHHNINSNNTDTCNDPSNLLNNSIKNTSSPHHTINCNIKDKHT